MPQARAVAGRRLAALLAAGVALFAGGRAGAGALDNSWVGTRAIAMGSAFTGLADDPSAIYYNAAGLAFLAPGRTRAEAYGYLSSRPVPKAASRSDSATTSRTEAAGPPTRTSWARASS